MNLSMVLEKFLRADTGIDLCRGNVGMSQHPADGFYRHTCFKRNQRGEAVPRLMVAQIILDACQCRQRFHVSSEIRPMQQREQGVPILTMIFFNQRNRFR